MMKALSVQPKLVEQVHRAILSEIAEGKLAPGARIIQGQIANGLGVSRQPVQQALLLLRDHGVLRDAPGRGLIVAELDLERVRNMCAIGAVVEGLAFRTAAEKNAERARKSGPPLIQSGRKAAKSGSPAAMMASDRKFHDLIYALSENPMIGTTMEALWTDTQRAMGEVLMRDAHPQDIWTQHEEMLAAVIQGDGETAEKLARQHVLQAANVMIARLQSEIGALPTSLADGAPTRWSR